MDGERKLTVFAFGLSMFCITILYSFLFISLWQYRQFVGLSLLGVIVAMSVVFMKGKLNEQKLRQARYRFNEELPLDGVGEPHYWPAGAQPNPNHSSFYGASASPSQEGYQYSGYQSQERRGASNGKY